MPIALSPSHPRYGKVPARGGGAARKSTPLVNDNAHGATSINIPMASAHASTPSTPPRHSRRPSTSSSSSSNSFGFDRSPPINQAFLDALEAPVTPTRPSQSAAFPLARSPDRGAPTASIHTRAADALLPPAVVGGPTEKNARFHPRHARQSPPATPTRRNSTRPTRPCPRARQVKPLAALTRAPDAAQNAEAGPSKGKGKRRAEDSEDDDSGLASPKRARTASTPNVPINQNAIESAIAEPQPAPQPEPAPALVAHAVRVEKRRMEDGPLLSPLKRIRFAVDAPPAKLPALATLLEEAEDEDAAGPPSEFQLGEPGSTSPARGPRAQGPDGSPSARVKAQRSPRPSVLRPSAFRSAHDRRAAPHARRARPRTAGARTSPDLEESPVAQASRRLQEITASEDTDVAAPDSARALLWPAGLVRVYCTESEIAQELFGSDEDLDFQSGQGASSPVAASAMDWATECVDAEEAYYEDAVMASPSSSPGPRGRTLSSSMDMDVDLPGSLDIGAQDAQDEVRDEAPPAYLRPFRVDRDGDVIMHGPCTLRLPSDRRALKIVFASEVRKRRVEASDKRRRSHLLR
ncbi:hypothetical protein BOTBODRAFT_178786 [Botryobasidium botryosum FD-172 SS1]|uniref:Uncharacterized protein n=1 Tax=Botryobasidium botryosum (strain FD-172 SS1) TaxID=930990 RepID=A0A067M1T0_BOTB1|nr:hypothetical protein BOTBODRAFT_178786 [Botryobasidium botryosum FD-172 SS1]